MAKMLQRAGAGALALFAAAGAAMAQDAETLRTQAQEGAQVCRVSAEEMTRVYRESAVHVVRFDAANDRIIASVPNGAGQRTETALDERTFANLAMAAAIIPTPGPTCPTNFWNSKFIVNATSAYSAVSTSMAAAPR